MAQARTSRVETTVLADLVDELYTDAEAAALARASGRPRGPVTGIAGLDAALGSFLAPGVHQIQAPPGAGKTAFTLQMAAACQYPAVFVSCEMPRIELFRRVIARTQRTFLGRLKNGDLPPHVIRERAIMAAAAVPQLAIMDATRAYAHPFEDILPTAQRLRDRFGTSSVLVILDSLQVWARAGAGDATEYERVNAALTAALNLAGELNGPVIAVSHMNRAGNRAQTGGQGGLHAGKGSGDIEYAVESVIELKPLERTEHLRQIELHLHKNRHGDAGFNLPLTFEGRVQEFRE